MAPIIATCSTAGAKWLIFSENVPPLVYYSHLPIIFISLLIGFFVYVRAHKSRESTALFYTTIAFALWVLLDSIFWASNRSDIIMFVWSVILIIEPMVYAGCVYLIHTIGDKRDLSFQNKLVLGSLFLPIFILVPTSLGLSAFDTGTCLAVEGPIALYYTYIVEIVCTLWIIGYAARQFRRTRSGPERRQLVLLSCGIVVFLTAFAWGNIIGSFTEDWNLAQFGLFGMPVFIGFLAYMIVKFRLFNIRLVGAQALVATLWILIGSLLLVVKSTPSRIIASITLLLVVVFGVALVRSVRKEIKQRERIEKQEKALEAANARLKELDQLKSEFVSLATHQIRGPISAIKGYASMLLEGDYGAIEEKAREPIQTIADSSAALAGIVQDFLDVSRIEQGRMKYEFTVFDFGKLARSVAEELAPTIERKGLRVKLEIPDGITVHADAGKLRQVIENLVDNAHKYTQRGVITIAVTRRDGAVRLTVSDTGVGMRPEVLPKLFRKFSRAEDASKANLHGTGLGLYVARQLIEAQGGKIWAESEGEGRGSTFTVELPTR